LTAGPSPTPSFTLDRLKHPSDEEKTILSAIVYSAGENMPRPGDKIRAVGVNLGDLGPGLIALSAGMLTLEPPNPGSQALAPALGPGPS
jgi:hypothetical protein